MSDAYRSFLRSYRKRSGLTQDELAYLAGLKDGSSISKIERLHREPELKTLLTCEALFQVPAQDLFPGTQRKVELGVRPRAVTLLRQLQEELRRSPHDQVLMDKVKMLAEFLKGREGGPSYPK